MNGLQRALMGTAAVGVMACAGCSGGNPVASSEPVRMGYNTIQCEASPWGDEDAKSHYESLGATVLDTGFVTYQKVVTAACGAPTGQMVTLTVPQSDTLILKNDGFEEYTPTKPR